MRAAGGLASGEARPVVRHVSSAAPVRLPDGPSGPHRAPARGPPAVVAWSPMVKTKTEFVCRSCGARSIRWSGRCGTCREWDSLDESTTTPPASTTCHARSVKAGDINGKFSRYYSRGMILPRSLN